MNTSTHSITPWTPTKVVSIGSSRVIGYDVQRIHNPYTDKAKVEYLEKGRIFRTEGDALRAIEKASGDSK